MSCENSQSHLECVETNQKIFFHTLIQKSYRIKNIAITEYKGSSYFVTAENVFYPLCDRNKFTTSKHLHSTFFCAIYSIKTRLFGY